MKFSQFQRRLAVSKQDLYREVFAEHRRSMRIKREPTALRNLERIFDTALRISNRKGFHAMSMRDLSRETGLSMGALYSYFSSKEELLEMLQRQGRTVIRRILEQSIQDEEDPAHRLKRLIQTHIYLSEVMQPWFYFSYMETKNLSKAERKKAIGSEIYTEHLIADTLRQGQGLGIFASTEPHLTASVIKAMLQDWYLKRWKYRGRHITVDQYADFVTGVAEAFCLSSRQGGHSLESQP
jgi:AcrR family transcriptional regulator